VALAGSQAVDPPVRVLELVPVDQGSFRVQHSASDNSPMIAYFILSPALSSFYQRPLCNPTIFKIDLDPIVPSFISDEIVLLFLASIAAEQDDRDAQPIIGLLLPPTSLPLVPYADSDEESGDVVEVTGPISPSSPRREGPRR
jgi:hypothetical protein